MWLHRAVIFGLGHWPELPVATDHILSASESRGKEERERERERQERESMDEGPGEAEMGRGVLFPEHQFPLPRQN